MREILFRGKRLVDGEWIVGYFVVAGRYSAIKPKGEVYYGVDPSTVGQFTGLTDKNGVWIFEGDIVRDLTLFMCHKGREQDAEKYLANAKKVL